jgi:hypothetical protein
MLKSKRSWLVPRYVSKDNSTFERVGMIDGSLLRQLSVSTIPFHETMYENSEEKTATII